jgi:hypothetical protein
MDEEWAIGILEWWAETAEKARAGEYTSGQGNRVYGFVNANHKSIPALRHREDQTRRVLAHVLDLNTLPTILRRGSSVYWVEDGLNSVRYALGRLKTQAETRAKLGSSAPSMSADALHPLVWNAASERWGVGHYADAVQRAATFLNANVQDKVGRRDVSDSELMREVFSTSPATSEKPRLRWPGKDSDLTVKSMRVGILSMAQGVFSAIRNPATHSTENMERQEALEQLATLSILARWIDRCELASG